LIEGNDFRVKDIRKNELKQLWILEIGYKIIFNFKWKSLLYFDEVLWAKQGDTVGWLTSEIFGLKQARSKEAEIAIEAAEVWMRNGDINELPDNLRSHTQIHQELLRVLPGHDPFWPRWIVTSEKRSSGV
jgi:hypothetical protein